jgi:hypothetical protein
MKPNTNLTVRLMFIAAIACCLGGCFQLETVIKVQPDGGATITERVRFSQRLLELDTLGQRAGDASTAPRLSDMLTRQAAEQRLRQMGEGVRLVSHEVRDAEHGSREAIAVYAIDDIRGLQYTSPFLAAQDYATSSKVKGEFFPLYEGTWWGRRGGEMAIDFKLVGPPPKPADDAAQPPSPSPADLQVLRDLQPVFRDMAKDFHVRVTVESYAPVRGRYRHRNFREDTKLFDLIDFSGRDLDRLGGGFLDNEEIMLDLLRGNLATENITKNVEDYSSNVTVPVFHPRGCGEIWFKPSRELFDRYFTGKMITFYFEKGPDRTRPATFKEIGYEPETQKKK